MAKIFHSFASENAADDDDDDDDDEWEENL